MNSAVIALIILGIITIILVKELLPIGTVGLGLLVIMVLTKILDAPTALSYLGNATVIQVACAYTISAAILEVGIADRIGVLVKNISSKQKDSERIVLLLIIATTVLVGLILPRFATTAALMPIMISVARITKVSRSKILMLLALTVNFGGANTLMSTPPNLLANGVLADSGHEIFSYFEFAWIGIPIAIGGAIFIILFEKKLLPTRIKEDENYSADNSSDARTVPKYKVCITLVAFAVFILGIMFSKQTGIGGEVTAILAVFILMAGRVLTEKKAFNAVSWSTVFFIAGILAMGKGMETSGASTLIADAVCRVLGESPSPYLITAVLFIAAAIMTQVMSNTGAAGLLFPIGLSIAAAIGADPRAVIMAIVVGCGSSFMTPIATPSNTMVMEPGDLKFKDFLKTGTPLMVITFILSMIILPLKWPFY
ncbi:MAG: SLC13 family permease [Suipraeoptans sp.]